MNMSRKNFFFTFAFSAGIAGCLLTIFLFFQKPQFRIFLQNENRSVRIYPVGSIEYHQYLQTEKKRFLSDSSGSKDKTDLFESSCSIGFQQEEKPVDFILATLNELEKNTSCELDHVRDFLSLFSESDLSEKASQPFLIPLNSPCSFMEQGSLNRSIAKNPLNRIRFYSEEEIIFDFSPEIRILRSTSPTCLGGLFFFLFCSMGICSPGVHLFSSLNDPVLKWILFLNDLKRRFFSIFGSGSELIPFTLSFQGERSFILPVPALEATGTTVLLR